MKKITPVLAMLFVGTVAINAQFQLPKKTTTKEEQRLGNLNKNKNTGPKIYKPTEAEIGKILSDARKKSNQKRGLLSSPDGKLRLIVKNRNFTQKFDKTIQTNSTSESKGKISTKQTVKLSANTITFNQFGDDSWVKPGALITAKSYIDGDYRLVVDSRNPITIYSSLRGNINTSETIDDPSKLSQINTSVNQLQSQDLAKVQANLVFTYKEVHSNEELGFHLNADYSNPIANGYFNIDTKNERKSHHYLIEFSQKMFHIDVDPLDYKRVFRNQNKPTDGLLYLSRITYGRRGLILLKSDVKLSKVESKLKASVNTMIHNGNLRVGLNVLNKDEEFSYKALYYGGTPESAINSIVKSIEDGKPDFEKYLNDKASNPVYALPISYEIKNIFNEQLGIRSVFNKTITTTTPPLTNEVKLRVTLTDLNCIEDRDGGGNGDDYGLSQYIVYRVNGKNTKAIDSDIRKFKDRNIEVDVNKKKNLNQIINGDKNNQIHVRKTSNRNGNINNSLTFKITPQAFEDSKTKFEIHTWLKEYTGSSDKVLANFKKIEVDLKHVIGYLLSANDDFLNFSSKFYYDGISRDKFHESGLKNQVLWLSKTSRNTIEGPIPLGQAGMRGAVWMHFELVD